MKNAPRPPLSRRGLLAAGGALGLGGLLAACGGSADDGKSPGGGGSGPWSFTDDRGEKLKADRRPRNIVAFVGSAAALYDYGIECTGIFGPSEPVDGKRNPQTGELDLGGLTSLGNAWGEFSIEKYAGLKPDLLISNMFPPPDLWFVPPESAKKIDSLAPTLGISVAHTTLLDPLKRYEKLARSLGADLEAKKVTEARARFEKAERTLREAAKARGGLKVLAMTGDQDQMYVAVPESYTDLHYFKDLGVEFVQGKKSDEFGFWEFLSWENADKYHADLIMVDNRASALPAAELAKKPVWAGLPAVKAGQTTPWAMEERCSYRGYAPVVERLAAALKGADKLKP
ncbi:ABC transporter substrate-binding protein [Streptomyces sp. N2-109]|uniref:ABC transporter substrate-binding protein n=1 Tax=Streptomyces gossypii TaxID=2883101 RepID=A0ABT2JQK6_9ACTN|nr:ABC transporter substrate-binding protein [Streptomyces gossypii]MCT2590101.1 ABC transporter substrate-binding protein [Streptomyces gossypii]